jgi:hypothetical protein
MGLIRKIRLIVFEGVLEAGKTTTANFIGVVQFFEDR